MFTSARFQSERDSGGCAISGIMSESGKLFGGEQIIRSIANMHDRSNGLGGGFAAYGIYPEHADRYALHVMYETSEAKRTAEAVVREQCDIHADEPIPTRALEQIRNRPILHRYFITVKPDYLGQHYDLTPDDVIVELVMKVNSSANGAFVFSSGKNMGIFKGVGYPEEIGRFFRIDEYDAYIWTAHGRFPTNTTGWWGGAHPFGLLDWSVVHNGEISSYGRNRLFLMNFGYKCTLQTDTEVITYIFDLLMRKHKLPLDAACIAMAPPFWSQIERMGAREQETARTLRMVYGGALLNGPFSVLVANTDGMIGFNNRIKLRPMCAARKNDMVYIASEEAAIRVVCSDPDDLWHARGGVPIVARLKEHAHGPAAPRSGRLIQ